MVDFPNSTRAKKYFAVLMAGQVRRRGGDGKRGQGRGGMGDWGEGVPICIATLVIASPLSAIAPCSVRPSLPQERGTAEEEEMMVRTILGLYFAAPNIGGYTCADRPPACACALNGFPPSGTVAG